MMTRKDFLAIIAAVVYGRHETLHTIPDDSINAWELSELTIQAAHDIIRSLADVCQANNPNFDRQRFFDSYATMGHRLAVEILDNY